MKLSIVGVGYVGLVAGACFSDVGNEVTCVDVDEKKISDLNRGKLPIYEPGLKELVERNVAAGRLRFTTDLAEAVQTSLVLFLTVNTPMAADGSADLSALLRVSEQIAEAMTDYRIIVVKSTAPVGTNEKISRVIAQKTRISFDCVSNPEFLKEGEAIEDFMKPDRVVIGTKNLAVGEILKELYRPFMRSEERALIMAPASAELTKYAANTMLASRISFMNEIARLCEKCGADVEQVRQGVGSDSRLGHSFLHAGVGYGGSCFPKDVQALAATGHEYGARMRMTMTIHQINQEQRQHFAQKILKHYDSSVAGKTFALWGLTYKAGTDDVRESPAIAVALALCEAGAKLRVHDPHGMEKARTVLPRDVGYFEDDYEATAGADALVVLTGCPEFREPDFDRLKASLAEPLIFDGRNLYDPWLLARKGFTYLSVGRPVIPPDAKPSGRIGERGER